MSRGEIYDELPLPSAALRNGGAEILRAGVVDDELFITARRLFDDPTQWGGALADIARRLATLYAAESDVGEDEVVARIFMGFGTSLTARHAAHPAKRRAAAKSPAPGSAARAKPKPARRKPARAKR